MPMINGTVQPGVCTAGDYWGCNCASVCGPSSKSGPCNADGCNGVNTPGGNLGRILYNRRLYGMSV